MEAAEKDVILSRAVRLGVIYKVTSGKQERCPC